jgi:hypothetical protein
MFVRVEIDSAIPGRLARPDDADPAQGSRSGRVAGLMTPTLWLADWSLIRTADGL